MMIAIYEFKAHPGQESNLEAAWAEVTDAIYEVQGSLGSRLHRTDTKGLYIAYAQWPSRATYEASDPARYNDTQQAARMRMREAMAYVKTLHLLDVCDDRLHDAPSDLAKRAILRVARPTDHLDAITKMYSDGLSFESVGRFEDHDGFDGAILSHPNAPYHLEFTSASGHTAGRSPSKDHLLVFYLPDAAEWDQACEKMTAAGFTPVPSFNPYWDRNGRTFEDLEGYRVVLQNTPWDR